MFIIIIIIIIIDEIIEFKIKNLIKSSLFIVILFIIIMFIRNIDSAIIHIDTQLLHENIIKIDIVFINFIIIFNCIINKRFLSFLLYQSNPLIIFKVFYYRFLVNYF